MSNQEPARESSTPKWLIIGGGCLLVGLLGVGGCVALVFFGLGKAKDSLIYKQALGQVQGHSEAQKELGTPIEGGMPSSFHYSVGNSLESGDIAFTVRGPKGEGTVTAAGKTSAGRWQFSVLRLLTPAGNTIDLLKVGPGAGQKPAPAGGGPAKP